MESPAVSQGGGRLARIEARLPVVRPVLAIMPRGVAADLRQRAHERKRGPKPPSFVLSLAVNYFASVPISWHGALPPVPSRQSF